MQDNDTLVHDVRRWTRCRPFMTLSIRFGTETLVRVDKLRGTSDAISIGLLMIMKSLGTVADASHR